MVLLVNPVETARHCLLVNLGTEAVAKARLPHSRRSVYPRLPGNIKDKLFFVSVNAFLWGLAGFPAPKGEVKVCINTSLAPCPPLLILSFDCPKSCCPQFGMFVQDGSAMAANMCAV